MKLIINTMIRNKHSHLLVPILLILSHYLLQAQPYPITAQIQVMRFTSTFEDLNRPGNIILTLFSTDQRTTYPALLRLSVSANGVTFRTRPDFFPAPILLNRNQSHILTGILLQEYFDPSNLLVEQAENSDIASVGYLLPDGPITVCVEVFDYFRHFDPPVSNTSCTNGFIQLHRPPVIIEPGELVEFSPIQNIRFSWQPQHAGIATRYTLEIYEAIDGFAPNITIQTSAPVAVINTNNPNYTYSQFDPHLFSDRTYIIRVRAYDSNGQAQFINDGWSEVYSFKFRQATTQEDCPQPTTPFLLDHSNGTLRWQWMVGDTLLPIRLRYRTEGSIEWQTIDEFDRSETGIITAQLLQVFSDTLYALECCFLCEDGNWYCAPLLWSKTSATDSSDEPPLVTRCSPNATYENEYSCGDASIANEDTAVELICCLVPGDTVIAGDFWVILSSVNGNNLFSGEGYISAPYFQQAQLKTTFQNIQVDKRCRMVSGHMDIRGATLSILVSINQLSQQLLEQLNNADQILSQLSTILEGAQQIIDQITTQADFLELQQQALQQLHQVGQSFPFVSPTTLSQLDQTLNCIQNAQDDTTFLMCRDSLQQVLEQLQLEIEELYSEAPFQVHFIPSAEQEFGTDIHQYNAHDNLYTKLTIAGQVYFVPWKSLPTNETEDHILATPNYGVQFLDARRDSIEVKDSLQYSSLLISSNNKAVYAVCHQPDSSITIAGQLQIASYDPKIVNIVIIPVNQAQIPVGTIEYLSSIWKQAVVEAQVQIHSGINLADFNGQLEDITDELFSAYTPSMRSIVRYFSQNHDINPSTRYLFVVPSNANPQRLGYMPRGKKWGFIFIENHLAFQVNPLRTMAHELGHGAFALTHSFADYPELPPGSTQNLMDYSDGHLLQKYQWDQIHSPIGNLILFDDTADGSQTIIESIAYLHSYRNPDSTYTFLAPSGKPITLPPNTTRVSFNTGDEIGGPSGLHPPCFSGFSIFPFGSLRYFEIGDKAYKCCISCDDRGDFAGYYALNPGDTGFCMGDRYLDTFSYKNERLNIQQIIIGLPCFEDQRLKFNLGQISVDQLNIDALYSNPYYAAGQRVSYDFLIPISSAITAERSIPAHFYPPLTEKSLHFISKNAPMAACGSATSLYLFTHAHQISAYNTISQECIDLIVVQNENNRNETYRDILEKYQWLNDRLGEEYNFGIQDTHDILTAAEISAWQEANLSVYRAYYQLLSSDWSTNFWNNLRENNADDARMLLEILYSWRNYPCIFTQLTAQQRIKSIRLLSLLNLTEDNFIDVAWFNIRLGEHHFPIIPYPTDEMPEEHLLNLLLASAPSDQFAPILVSFRSDNYDLYFTIIEKMLDWSDDQDFIDFASLISNMVLATEPKTALISTQTTANSEGDMVIQYYCDIADQNLPIEEQPVKKIVFCPSFGGTTMAPQAYSSSYDDVLGQITFHASYDCPPPYNQADSYSFSLSPFDYVALIFEGQLTYQLPNEDERQIADGSILLMPACWVDLTFRILRDAHISLRTRQALDMIGIMTLPYSFGQSSTAIRFLGNLDAAYSAVDLSFAHDQYDFTVSNQQNIPQQWHHIWNQAGIVLAAANAGQLVNLATSTAVHQFNIRNTLATLRQLQAGSSNAPDGIHQLWSKLCAQLESLPNQAPPGISPTEYNAFIHNLQTAIDQTVFNTLLVNAGDPAVIHFTHIDDIPNPTHGDDINYRAYLFVNEELSYPIGTIIQENSTQTLLPDFFSDAPFQEIAKLRNIRYVNEDARIVVGDLHLGLDPTEGSVIVRAGPATIDDILQQFPQMHPFYSLFQSKSWSWPTQFTNDIGQYITDLGIEGQTRLRQILSTWPAGLAGENIFQLWRTDVSNHADLRAYFTADISNTAAWYALHLSGIRRNTQWLQITRQIQTSGLHSLPTEQGCIFSNATGIEILAIDNQTIWIRDNAWTDQFIPGNDITVFATFAHTQYPIRGKGGIQLNRRTGSFGSVLEAGSYQLVRTLSGEICVRSLPHPDISHRLAISTYKYSQNSVSRHLAGGEKTIEEVIQENILYGYNIGTDPATIVNMQDGSYCTLDHRRLVAAYYANISHIPAKVVQWNQLLSTQQSRRFVLKADNPRLGEIEAYLDRSIIFDVNNEYKARTWGEAVLIRSANQTNPTIPITGSYEIPIIR